MISAAIQNASYMIRDAICSLRRPGPKPEEFANALEFTNNGRRVSDGDRLSSRH